ncbi:MAG: hypothetical protein LBU14_00500 [Candidatus Peribacteria bacterium]|jgi:hypothetical protein|nr:hypothetical protein [Candidatus Peribacteria bacterium]
MYEVLSSFTSKNQVSHQVISISFNSQGTILQVDTKLSRESISQTATFS